MNEYFILKDGRRFVPAPLPKLPPVTRAPMGPIARMGDGRVFGRLRGDKVCREIRHGNQTNMTVAAFYIKNGNPVLAKYVMHLEERQIWLDEFRKDLGPVVWPLYVQPGFGFQDGNPENNDPVNGEYKQQTVDCGLNLRELNGNPFWTRYGQYVEIKSIDYYSNPKSSYDYTLSPHLMVKQTVVGKSTTQPVYYIAHQKHGDLEWPNLHTWQLIHAMANLELIPETPFKTQYSDIPVTIEAFGFESSSTYAYMYPDNAAQGEAGWRIAEYMEVSGLGSATFDRRTFLKDWIDTPPPPVKGWTRGK